MTNAKGVLEWMEWEKKRKANMTNEKWLKQCTTEQLAEFLADKCDIGDIDNDDYWYWQADFIEWLKEKHE